MLWGRWNHIRISILEVWEFFIDRRCYRSLVLRPYQRALYFRGRRYKETNMSKDVIEKKSYWNHHVTLVWGEYTDERQSKYVGVKRPRLSWYYNNRNQHGNIKQTDVRDRLTKHICVYLLVFEPVSSIWFKWAVYVLEARWQEEAWLTCMSLRTMKPFRSWSDSRKSLCALSDSRSSMATDSIGTALHGFAAAPCSPLPLPRLPRDVSGQTAFQAALQITRACHRSCIVSKLLSYASHYPVIFLHISFRSFPHIGPFIALHSSTGSPSLSFKHQSVCISSSLPVYLFIEVKFMLSERVKFAWW